PPKAPAPQAYSRTIDVRLALQPSYAILEVSQLQLAKVLVDRPRGFDPFAARGPVVADPDDVTSLGKHLVPYVDVSPPCVADLRSVRSAVGVCHHRILFGRIEVRRLDHYCIHFEPVAGVHLEKLGGSKLVLSERRPRLMCHPLDVPPGAADQYFARCSQIAVGVYEVFERGAEVHRMI